MGTRKLTRAYIQCDRTPIFGNIQRPTRAEAKKARRSSKIHEIKQREKKRLYIKRGRLAFSLITTTCKMTSTRTILGFFVTLSCLAFYVNAIPTFSLSQNEGKDIFFVNLIRNLFFGRVISRKYFDTIWQTIPIVITYFRELHCQFYFRVST